MVDEVTDDLLIPTKEEGHLNLLEKEEGHLKLLEKEEEDQEEDKDRKV